MKHYDDSIEAQADVDRAALTADRAAGASSARCNGAAIAAHAAMRIACVTEDAVCHAVSASSAAAADVASYADAFKR